jgi:bacterioferritin (cytochrome b1)
MTDSNFLSRRALLGGFAATGAAIGCGDDPAPSGPNPDIVPLNALLSAEYAAIKAYEAGLMILRSPPMGDPQTGVAGALAVIADNWRTHHRQHATALSSAITSIGGQPIAESTVMFAPPMGFSASVANVLRLACNAERKAAIDYNRAVAAMRSTTTRFLAASIEGDETQHFMVLYGLLKGVFQADPAGLITGIAEVVPKPFVSNVTPPPDSANPMNGLQGIADFMYT